MVTALDYITKKPLIPVITLKKNDSSTYTFNSFTSTFDFRVTYAEVSPPFDNTGGKFTLKITSSDGTNTNTNTILSNISAGNEVTFWIGKDNTTKTKIFLGVIESIEINEQNKNYEEVVISGPDWGSNILKNRVVSGQWIQKRTGGTTLDSTDNKVLCQQIAQDLLTQTQYYAGLDFAVDDQGVAVSDSNFFPSVASGNGIRVPIFTANYEFLDDKLRELDDIDGSIHYIDADKNFIRTQFNASTSSLPATFLFTDDHTDTTAWVSGKVGLIAPNSTFKKTYENHKKRLFGLGGDTERIDQSQTTTSSSTALDANWLAQKFTPVFRNLDKVSVYVSRTASTPTEDFILQIVEDNAGNPTGSTLRTVFKDNSFLNDTTTSASERWFSIGEELDTSKSYWIVLRKTGDATHTYKWHRDAGSSSTNAYSSDGTSWTVQSSSYSFAFRTYTSTPVLTVHTIGTYTSSSKMFKEDVIRKSDITDTQYMWQLLREEGNTLFKEKQIFKARVYAPDYVLMTGQKVRIRKQTSGLTFDYSDFILGGVEYVFEGSDDGSPGSFYYNIEAVRFS